MKRMEQLIEGIFKNECKGRFSCEVEIEGKLETCYVASSAKLSNFIDLYDRKVYLTRNQNSAKTHYTLYAAQNIKNNMVLLNLNNVNSILKEYLVSRGANENSLKSEITINNCYKADVVEYLESSIKLYEIKTILSRENNVIYPYILAKRIGSQLEKLIANIKAGYKVEYVFFILDPNIKSIKINNEIKELYAKALIMGMDISVYRTIWNDNKFYIEEDKNMKKEFKSSII
jgi:DNA-binding sugar fermentation-stimulating protein